MHTSKHLIIDRRIFLCILDTNIDHLSCLPESATNLGASGCIQGTKELLKAFHSVDTAMNECEIPGTPLPLQNTRLQHIRRELIGQCNL